MAAETDTPITTRAFFATAVEKDPYIVKLIATLDKTNLDTLKKANMVRKYFANKKEKAG
jgi:hypothetical protein